MGQPPGPTLPGQPSPTPATTTTTLVGHTPVTARVGAKSDGADFFGIFVALGVIAVAIVVIRLAFRPSRRPPRLPPDPPSRPRPGPPGQPGSEAP